jgi:hypothetical protein
MYAYNTLYVTLHVMYILEHNEGEDVTVLRREEAQGGGSEVIFEVGTLQTRTCVLSDKVYYKSLDRWPSPGRALFTAKPTA